MNSVLFVSTSSKASDDPKLYAWLDGSYPLGNITPPRPTRAITELHKLDNEQYVFQPQLVPLSSSDAHPETTLIPTKFSLPALQRDVAQTASSTRALVWYTMRLVKEMRESWFGTLTHNGAREIGPNWVRTLERKTAANFGGRLLLVFPPSIYLLTEPVSLAEDPNAILDLTSLLATGKATESLTDYLGSGEQMSERVRAIPCPSFGYAYVASLRAFKSGKPPSLMPS